jgi:hypothetical protein
MVGPLVTVKKALLVSLGAGRCASRSGCGCSRIELPFAWQRIVVVSGAESKPYGKSAADFGSKSFQHGEAQPSTLGARHERARSQTRQGDLVFVP